MPPDNGRTLVTQAAYARHRGCSRRAVGKAIASGRLREALVKRKGKILIDQERADLAWLAWTDAAQAERSKAQVAGAAYLQARAAHDAVKLRRLQHELREMDARLIDKAASDRCYREHVAHAVERVMMLPAQIGRRLETMPAEQRKDPAAVIALIDECNRQAAADIAKGPQPAQ